MGGITSGTSTITVLEDLRISTSRFAAGLSASTEQSELSSLAGKIEGDLRTLGVLSMLSESVVDGLVTKLYALIDRAAA